MHPFKLPFRPRLLLAPIAFAASLSLSPLVLGQDPTSTPASTPTDTAAPAPTAAPTPTAAPKPTATPTPPDLNSAAYVAPRTPQATVQLSSSAATQPAPVATSASAVTMLDTAAPVAPSATSIQPPLAGANIFSPTALSVQPESAAVTLTYDPSMAGAQVLVAPLDGGTINGQSAGTNVTVAADGTASFTFQAPAHAGLYHVITRLDTVEIALPFEVAAPPATLPPTIGNATS